jgi:predicted ATPase
MNTQDNATNRQTGITSITIENFKGISASVTIPLRPITLLFGANSAGKSTILQALHYVRELLDRNNANPDHTLLGGDAIEMGGFRNLVYKHDLERQIRIGIEITPTDDGVPTVNELLGTEDGEVSSESALNINPQVSKVALELAARWDYGRQEGWFFECRYVINGKPVITIRKPKPDMLPAIEEINYFHPSLLAMDGSLVELENNYRNELKEFRSTLVTELLNRLSNDSQKAISQFSFDVIRSDTGEAVLHQGDLMDHHTISRLVDSLPNIKCSTNAEELLPPGRVEIEEAVKRFQEKDHEILKSYNFHPLIQLTGQTSPAPVLHQPLPFSPEALGEELEMYCPTVNQIIIGITSLVQQYLKGFRYIGPIRAIPDRDHSAPQIEDPARWANGLGAWDLLLRHYDRVRGKNDIFIKDVSKWFEDKDRLDLGCRIEVSGLRYISEDSLLMSNLKLLQTQYDERNQHDYRENVWNPLQRLPQSSHIRIVDIRTKTEVGPKDIGIGVAQVFPIVVGSLDSKSKFLAIEQPELHLHPAAQARLGDLFVTQAKSERLFLIETHSETLMLRIFRRIRETTRNKIPRKDLQLTKDEVALLFLSSGEKGTSVSEIRLDDQGKFIDPVPGGFFEEGFDELF